MKWLLKKLLARAVANDTAWLLLDRSVLQAARFAEWERQKIRPSPEDREMAAAIQRQFPDLTVCRGPFQGLRFPAAESATGRLFGKLIGSYEMELHPILESVCQTPYTEIVNVGCGDGYYAVGLARRIPGARVHAVDPDPAAREQCRRMAEWNGVSDRVTIEAGIDAAGLQQFPFTHRGFVISDCEGFEGELFTADTARALARHDVLIEVHDFVDIQLSQVLRERFAGTHELTVITSLDDVRKTQTCEFPELADYPPHLRLRLLAEKRRYLMDWFFLSPLPAKH